MRRLTSRRSVLVVIAAFVLFYLGWLMLPRPTLKELADALRLGSSIIVSALWVPVSIRVIRDDNPLTRGEATLFLGISMLWLSLSVQGIYAIAVRWLGRPDYLLESGIDALIPFMITVAAFHFLLSPGRKDTRLLSSGVRLSVIALVLGVFVAGVMTGAYLSGMVAAP